MNRGYLVRGTARSERLTDLQIVSDELFFKAQEIMEQRARKGEDKRQIAMTNKGKALLVRDMIKSFEESSATQLAISHNSSFLQPKDKVINDLKRIYERKQPGEAYIYID